MFFLGLIGVFGVMMYAAITGGNPGAFIDLPSLIVVVVASFFAALAMSKGKFDERTISLTGDAAVIVGWLGFLIGLVLMAGDLKNLLALYYRHYFIVRRSQQGCFYGTFIGSSFKRRNKERIS